MKMILIISQQLWVLELCPPPSDSGATVSLMHFCPFTYWFHVLSESVSKQVARANKPFSIILETSHAPPVPSWLTPLPHKKVIIKTGSEGRKEGEGVWILKNLKTSIQRWLFSSEPYSSRPLSLPCIELTDNIFSLIGLITKSLQRSNVSLRLFIIIVLSFPVLNFKKWRSVYWLHSFHKRCVAYKN